MVRGKCDHPIRKSQSQHLLLIVCQRGQRQEAERSEDRQRQQILHKEKTNQQSFKPVPGLRRWLSCKGVCCTTTRTWIKTHHKHIESLIRQQSVIAILVLRILRQDLWVFSFDSGKDSVSQTKIESSRWRRSTSAPGLYMSTHTWTCTYSWCTHTQREIEREKETHRPTDRQADQLSVCSSIVEQFKTGTWCMLWAPSWIVETKRSKILYLCEQIM